MKKIVIGLFPQHQNSRRQKAVKLSECAVPLENEELRKIRGMIGDNKSSASDDISNEALKVAVQIISGPFANTFVACQKEGIFTAQW